MIETVQYKQWISTDRSTLEAITNSADEFMEFFCEKLKILLQSAFHMEVNSSLQSGVFQVITDFAENYSFILQDEAQGFQWNNSQASIHPFVIYYTESSGELHQLSFVVISDCLHHDTVAIYVFKNAL